MRDRFRSMYAVKQQGGWTWRKSHSLALAGFLKFSSNRGTSRCLCNIQNRLDQIAFPHYGTPKGLCSPFSAFRSVRTGEKCHRWSRCSSERNSWAAPAANLHGQDRRSRILNIIPMNDHPKSRLVAFDAHLASLSCGWEKDQHLVSVAKQQSVDNEPLDMSDVLFKMTKSAHSSQHLEPKPWS